MHPFGGAIFLEFAIHYPIFVSPDEGKHEQEAGMGVGHRRSSGAGGGVLCVRPLHFAPIPQMRLPFAHRISVPRLWLTARHPCPASWRCGRRNGLQCPARGEFAPHCAIIHDELVETAFSAGASIAHILRACHLLPHHHMPLVAPAQPLQLVGNRVVSGVCGGGSGAWCRRNRLLRRGH